MADEEKKISFGFSKIIKKSTLQIPLKQETKKVDYIECLDGKSIKVLGEETKKDEELVIPMLGSKTWCDRILNKTDADIFETKKAVIENGGTTTTTTLNRNGTASSFELTELVQIKKEVPDEDTATPTLEEQAANEIIEDLKNEDTKVEDPCLAVPVVDDDSLRGKQQSTLEDYDEIPVDGFGLAVLRGMGWKPGKGIGKNEKLIASTVPELRPRGMGLGADKLSLQKQTDKPKTKEEEQLKIEKGSFVRVITGKLNNNYGQIEGFDDGAGRFIVKMALTGEILSLNENVVEPVTKADFTKNSKVLNATKYEEYNTNKLQQSSGKNSVQSAGVVTSDCESSDDRETSNRRGDKSKNSRHRKKSKKRSRHSSDDEEEINADDKSRKRGNSSDNSSDYEYRQKKLKKSKKSHKHRDSSSPERGSKSSYKKKSAKTKDHRERCLESSDRRRHKKHKKSRSRSPRRR